MKVVVLLSPVFDFSLSIFRVSEYVFIQTFIPQSRVERLDVRILIWFPRIDGLVFDSQSIQTIEKRHRDELWPVVTADSLRTFFGFSRSSSINLATSRPEMEMPTDCF